MTLVGETFRLRLNHLTPEDAATLFALNADPVVLRFTGDAPFPDEDHARQFLLNYDAYALTGFGRWAVRRKDTGEMIGWCGLKKDPETGEVDLGFRFFRTCWNQGFATEAAVHCLWLARERFGLHRVMGRAMAGNAASVRVLEKAGMVYCGKIEREGHTWLVYEVIWQN
jgi:RimJ/RimL family protein N-acetyltransferase